CSILFPYTTLYNLLFFSRFFRLYIVDGDGRIDRGLVAFFWFLLFIFIQPQFTKHPNMAKRSFCFFCSGSLFDSIHLFTHFLDKCIGRYIHYLPLPPTSLLYYNSLPDVISFKKSFSYIDWCLLCSIRIHSLP